MTSSPSVSQKLESWEVDVLAAVVEDEFTRASEQRLITRPQAWKRARFVNLRAEFLVDAEARSQLERLRDRLLGPSGRPGTFAERRQVLRDLEAEWASTPNASAYRRPVGDELERLIDRCVAERHGARTPIRTTTADLSRRRPVT